MVLTELKKLFTDKQYRLYLILVIWLIIGFSLFQFYLVIPSFIAIAIFTPLLGVCIALFIASLFFRIELKKASYKKILFIIIIAVICAILFSVLWTFIYVRLYVIAVFSYIIISAIFYMYGCYNYGVDWDEDISNLRKPFNKILRWMVFIGGTVLSLIILFILTRITMIAIYIMIIMVILAIIGIITLLMKKQNTWLGIFFLWVSLYSVYLILNISFALNNSETSYDLWVQVVLYLLDIFMIIYVITTIIGTKTEVLSEKFKFIKPDSILIWLIFSKAAYEFGRALYRILPSEANTMNVTVLNAIMTYLIFIPLFAIAGIYGIIKYSKISN